MGLEKRGKKVSSPGCGLCAAASEKYRVVMENQHAFAVITRDPQIPYHSLVLPKRHVTSFSKLEPEESRAVHRMLEKLTKKMDKVLGSSSIVAINGAKYRTQPHTHYQVLPVSDGLRTIISGHLGIPERSKISKTKLTKMAQKLK